MGLLGQLEIIEIISRNCTLILKQEKLENIKTAWREFILIPVLLFERVVCICTLDIWQHMSLKIWSRLHLICISYYIPGVCAKQKGTRTSLEDQASYSFLLAGSSLKHFLICGCQPQETWQQRSPAQIWIFAFHFSLSRSWGKRGWKFAMTSSLQKCWRCWHVSNLLKMFHSHLSNWARGGEGGSSGFLLVLISCLRPLIGQMVNDIEGVTQAKATLPINKNCIKESKSFTCNLAMNLRTPYDTLRRWDSEDAWIFMNF